ncbi:MAG: hypothetical protein Kow00117_12240 [Phototrophicales bacterium]
MYIKTPKRYRRGAKQRGLISMRTILIWLLVPPLIVIGIGIYENRSQITPWLTNEVNRLVSDVDNTVRQINAPAPTPTPDPSSDKQRAFAAWERGAIQEAIAYFKQAAPNAPNDLQVHYYLTLGLINQGQVDEALTAAQKAVNASPFSPDAWAIQAMVLNRLERPGEAIVSASRALQLVPESLIAAQVDPNIAQSLRAQRARALAFLAEAYLIAGQGERARATVDDALELYPDSQEALVVSGRIYSEVDFDFSTAKDEFEAAYALDPRMTYAAIWLARIDSREENYTRSIEIYEGIINRNPGNTLALFELADYYFRVEGNPNEALTYLQRCIEADPEYAGCHYLRGRVLIREEQAAEALISFQTAHDLDQTNGYYTYWLARAHMDTGQCQLALPYLEEGYRRAVEENTDTVLIESFEYTLNQARVGCGVAPVVPVATPTPLPGI